VPRSDPEAAQAARRALDAKTKPRGSLGRLEELAVRIASIRGTPRPGRLRAAIVLAAADHGVAARGVSAYPQEVTGQMLRTYADGGAAVCVLARLAGADLHVFDLGVVTPPGIPEVHDLRIAPGTADLAEGPAMTVEQARRAIGAGRDVAASLARDGVGVLALAEMGIGNTTSASALAAALLPADPAAVCGRGTGIDDAGLARKVAAVHRAVAVNAGHLGDPVSTLAALGGFEIAFLTGAALEAAERNAVVLLDGFITGAAALAAERTTPGTRQSMIAAHVSAEAGHRAVLDALGLSPLLDLGLRLGEGSGAALALPLLHAAVAVLEEMATFDSAGVTDAGR
jgi:nicotinate-nucleotide--dimethylbenzimidazole phosphoribosyltransferase